MVTLAGRLRRGTQRAQATGAFTLETCGLSDLPALTRLHRRCFRRSLAYRLPTLFSLYVWPRSRFLVARSDGKIVGCVIGDRHAGCARVVSICVDPNWQGRGLGGRLLREIEAALPGGPMILMVEDANAPARRLYERHGYRELGLSRNYYGTGRNGIWMRKERDHISPAG
jgi:ribosomal protein S18 acetylase RimI-like enzyme